MLQLANSWIQRSQRSWEREAPTGNRWRWLAGVGTVAVFLALINSVRADRVPSTRSPGQRSSGARRDITVPYLTTGRSAFGAYSVAPRIFQSPIVDDSRYPQQKPVFN